MSLQDQQRIQMMQRSDLSSPSLQEQRNAQASSPPADAGDFAEDDSYRPLRDDGTTPTKAVEFDDVYDDDDNFADQFPVSQPQETQRQQRQPSQPRRQEFADDDSFSNSASVNDPAGVEFSSDLLSQAGLYGLSESQIKATCQNDSDLERLLMGMNHEAYNRAVAIQQAQWHAQQQAQQQGGQQQQSQSTDTGEDDLFRYDFKDEELWNENPELKEEFEGFQETVRENFKKRDQKLKQLEQFYQQQQQQQQQQQMLQRYQRFDEMIEGLGDDYADLFGRGPSTALPQGSPQLMNRQLLFNTQEAIMYGNQTLGRSGSEELAFKSALAGAFENEFQAKAERGIRRQVMQNSRRQTARPTHRDSNRNKSGRQMAMERWDRYNRDPDEMDYSDGV